MKGRNKIKLKKMAEREGERVGGGGGEQFGHKSRDKDRGLSRALLQVLEKNCFCLESKTVVVLHKQTYT